MPGTVTSQENANYLLQSAEISLGHNLYTLGEKKISLFLRLIPRNCLVCILLQYLLVFLEYQSPDSNPVEIITFSLCIKIHRYFFLPDELTLHLIRCIVFAPPFEVKDV